MITLTPTPLSCVEIRAHFGLRLRKNIFSIPFVLFFDDLQNEVSHKRGAFKVFELPPTTSRIPLCVKGRGGGEIAQLCQKSLSQQHMRKRHWQIKS